jgi:hypothetical protein
MRTGGVDGNERLTATTAVVLLVLLAVEGVTILFLRPLLSVHVFVGMLLIPPVLLKLGVTGWRFGRYYTGSRPYLLKGPPQALMRIVVAPMVVLSTLVLFASGVALIVAGPAGGILLGLHKVSFVVWFVTMSAHVLGYVWRLPRLASADWRSSSRLGGGILRPVLVCLAVVAGAALAAATVHLVYPWEHWSQRRREASQKTLAPCRGCRVPLIASLSVLPVAPRMTAPQARKTPATPTNLAHLTRCVGQPAPGGQDRLIDGTGTHRLRACFTYQRPVRTGS